MLREPASNDPIPFFVQAQAPIDRYRADFVVGLRHCPNAAKIVVECDGHDFHERTKDQADRDKARDRLMQSLGYIVFRFTGTELYRDALKCADEVINHLIRIEQGSRNV